MSAVATEPDEVHEDAHDHPSDKSYIKIAVLLAVLTALEVATYPAEEALGSLVIPILMVLMVVKFWYVAAFFMHLKFDTKAFSWMFIFGLTLASACYIGALSTFQYWAS